MDSVTMSNGVLIPLVGLGTYLIPDDDAESVVDKALEIGYRHIDTAEAYRNESGVGKGIQSGMKRLGLSRDDVFVTTKVWPGNEAWGNTPKDRSTTIDSLNNSLDRLGLDYVDLYLVHAPFNPGTRLDVWHGIVDLLEQGKTRAIGVSNYSDVHIEEIRSAGLTLPHANQIELHPWSQKPELVSYLKQNSILPIAYSSLVPMSTWRAVEGQHSGKSDEMKAEGEKDDSPFRRLARKYGVTEAQFLLRWGVQMGYPVLPKSTNEGRLRQNFDILSFTISDEDMREITTLDRGDGVAWSSGDPTKSS